jgi:hypothetical protein
MKRVQFLAGTTGSLKEKQKAGTPPRVESKAALTRWELAGYSAIL